MEHAGDRLVEQLEVVADDEEGAAIAAQELHEPAARVDVEVVRRLVEEEDVAPREQDAGELDAPSLTAGEHREREVDAVALDAETGDERAYLRLRRVATVGAERLLGAREPGDVRLAVVLLHREPQLLDADGRLVEATAGEDVRERGDAVEQPGDAGILREVAKRTVAVHDACRRRGGAPEHAQQAGLARAVAADETDLVTGADRQRGAFDDETAADFHRQLAGLQHEVQGYEDEPRFSVPFVRDP